VPPLIRVLDGVHEIAGVGTIFPGADGKPLLHIHLACGREGKNVTGCGRTGVKVWQVAEVIMVELTGTTARRMLDPGTGFELLQPEG
jgi:predicted DNA-binding protein with PD1-like motif